MADVGRRSLFGFNRGGPGPAIAGATDDSQPRCSFCGKTQADVRKLIEGPSTTICDACVDVCNDMLASEAAKATYTPYADPYSGAPGDEPLRCLICTGQIPPDEVVPIPARGAICRACAGPVRAAINRVIGS